MNNYQRINPATPKNIETRKAYLIGGGIGSLSAAAFLIRDGHMPGRNIHVIEQLDVLEALWMVQECRKKVILQEAEER